jgi:hypothetical protein
MSDEISVIKVFTDEMEASMAQQVLEDAGIKSYIQKDDMGGLAPSMQLTGGVRLIVNQDEAERAAELIRDYDNPIETAE